MSIAFTVDSIDNRRTLTNTMSNTAIESANDDALVHDICEIFGKQGKEHIPYIGPMFEGWPEGIKLLNERLSQSLVSYELKQLESIQSTFGEHWNNDDSAQGISLEDLLDRHEEEKPLEDHQLRAKAGRAELVKAMRAKFDGQAGKVRSNDFWENEWEAINEALNEATDDPDNDGPDGVKSRFRDAVRRLVCEAEEIQDPVQLEMIITKRKSNPPYNIDSFAKRK